MKQMSWKDASSSGLVYSAGQMRGSVACSPL